MKLIIDIPEDTAKEIKDNAMFAESIVSQIKWDVTSAIVNGTPIPDNATNGDVIKTIFGYRRISHCNDNPPLVGVYGLDNNDDIDAVTFYEAWWNAPYQKGGK